MNCAIFVLDTGVNSELALATLPGKGTSTGVEAELVSIYGPTPWLYAYRDRY